MHHTDPIPTLRDDAFLEQVREGLAAFGDDVATDAIESTITWIADERDDIAGLLELVGDSDEDVRMLAAVRLIELKSRWIAINNRVNYSLMKTGQFDPALPLRGAALSALIDRIERVLPERSVEAYHALLAEPFSPKVDLVLTGGAPRRHKSARKPKGRGRAAARRRNAGRRKAA